MFAETYDEFIICVLLLGRIVTLHHSLFQVRTYLLYIELIDPELRDLPQKDSEVSLVSLSRPHMSLYLAS